MAEQLKERKDIESAYLWDLTPIYESDEAWEKAFAQTESLAARFASYPGTLGQSPEHLREFYDLMYSAFETLERLNGYAFQRKSEDNRQDAAQSMYSRSVTRYVQLASAVFRAAETVVGGIQPMVGKHQLQHEFAILFHKFGIGVHHHAIGHARLARRLKGGCALDLDAAHATTADVAHVFQVTQRRNAYASFVPSCQNGKRLGNLNLHAVDGYVHELAFVRHTGSYPLPMLRSRRRRNVGNGRIPA